MSAEQVFSQRCIGYQRRGDELDSVIEMQYRGGRIEWVIVRRLKSGIYETSAPTATRPRVDVPNEGYTV